MTALTPLQQYAAAIQRLARIEAARRQPDASGGPDAAADLAAAAAAARIAHEAALRAAVY